MTTQWVTAIADAITSMTADHDYADAIKTLVEALAAAATEGDQS